ncbi:M48 family metallopeptidase [Dermacoccaceae bacterium W4C1]
MNEDPALEQPVSAGELPVEIRRSTRRRRTVSARLEQGRIIVMVPARLSKAQERKFVDQMVARIRAQTGRAQDEGRLADRAARLSQRYLQGRAKPNEVKWVSNQRSRWGSCSPASGVIRLSVRLQSMPQEVIDYVLLHELAHLLVPHHGPQFHALLQDYPHLERAKGFLDGVSHAESTGAAGVPEGAEDDDLDDVDEDDEADETVTAAAVDSPPTAVDRPTSSDRLF